MANHTLIGKRIPRSDSISKATGEAIYTADLQFPKMLYGKILRSPHAHARILNIDTSKAESLAGIKAVVTGNDTYGERWGVFRYTRDQELFPRDKVRYVGEEVAAVAAVDEDTAVEALELIDVEYEPLPAVFDPLQAMQEGAPELHEGVERNINIHVPIEVGDVEKAMQTANSVREDHFTDVEYTYCHMEPYAVVARFDLAGNLEVWMPNASPHTKAKALSNLLRMPLNRVKVRKIAIGGAFGGRSDIFPGEFIVALLAKKAQRPVKIVYSREETFTCVRQAHSMTVQSKIGVRQDGTILAYDIKAIMDGGAYSSTGPIATSVPMLVWEETYRIPNLRYNGYRIYTNKPVRGMYRCHGRAFLGGLGMQLDMIAEELGIDPVQLRLRNALQTGDTQATGSKVFSCGLSEAIRRAAERSGWNQKRGKLPFGRGIGMGANGMMVGFPMGIRGGSAAFLKFNEDGGASLITGVVDNGQGNDSMMIQIAADVLGMQMEDINLISADTEVTPLDQGAYSQAVAFVSGNAVKGAAEDARNQIFHVAAGMLEARPADLELREGKVFVKGSPARNIPLAKIIRTALLQDRAIMGRGFYMPDVNQSREWVSNPRGQLAGTFSFGAAVSEVDVDIETGQVRLVKVTGAHDCGRAINPMAVEGQFEGSVAAAGLGAGLSEGHLWTGGRILNANMLEYKIPLAVDMPEIEAIIVESNDPRGPFGAKEAGLFGSMNLFQAVGNAIYDAIGVWIKEFPITPDKVLKTLEEKGTD